MIHSFMSERSILDFITVFFFFPPVKKNNYLFFEEPCPTRNELAFGTEIHAIRTRTIIIILYLEPYSSSTLHCHHKNKSMALLVSFKRDITKNIIQ